MPRSVARLPDEGTLSRLETLQRPARALEWTFSLRTITPVLGGGVRPWVPDAVDGVRAPAVRGQLRGWWRLLYAREEESADALFQREASLWGGVDVPSPQKGKPPRALRSRVELRVKVTGAGKVEPAGVYERKQDGDLKSRPRWYLGENLAYGLFPLQLSEKERKAEQEAHDDDVPTRSQKSDLCFDLDVRLSPAPGEPRPTDDEMREVLGALWAWFHLGGLGARTRRGFGALDVVEVSGAGLSPAWVALFSRGAVPVKPLEELTRFSKLAGVEPTSGLGTATVLYRDVGEAPYATHRALVLALREFRQGVKIGRDPGTHAPGQSRWPEPHLLRIRVGGTAWAHKPTKEAMDAHAKGVLAAPRAAFGLPIQVKFQSGDTAADSTLKPMVDGVVRERWASSVILRPLVVGEGKTAPLVLILKDRPREVGFFSGAQGEKKPARGTAAVLSDGSGARDDIHTQLSGGSALRDGPAALSQALRTSLLGPPFTFSRFPLPSRGAR